MGWLLVYTIRGTIPTYCWISMCFFWLLGGTVLLGLVGWLVYASSTLSAQVYMPCQTRLATQEPVVCLTYDDGPSGVSTARVLRVLRNHGVRATFFCIGAQALLHRDQLQAMVRDGHAVGSHSFGHKWYFPLQSSSRIAAELRATQRALEAVCGQHSTSFRPPFGVSNPPIARAVRRVGLRPIGWTIRSFDTMYRSPARVVDRIVKRLCPGAIILLHDRLPQAAETTELLIEALHARGYRAVQLPVD